MTTHEIASRLVELCRVNDYGTAHKELYASDAVSIEPEAGYGFEKETKGMEAITAKGKQWSESVLEMHGTTISEPLVAGNSFVISLSMDITTKQVGRMAMTELCLYKVKDGKIISEEFFM